MRKIILPLFAFAVVFILASCGSTKDFIYLNGIDTLNTELTGGLYDAKIMPKDFISIRVTTTNPEVAELFNQRYDNTSGGNSNGLNSYGYYVDNDGIIRFPIIGDIYVQGLTIRECEDLIKSKITPYIAAEESLLVTVRMSSFHFTALGEVGSAGIKTVANGKVNVMEALAMSGDITIYGKRDEVLLLREDATGKKEVHRLDLTDPKIVMSPYYHLQQNDIIYVEPNKTKIYNNVFASSASLWFAMVGSVASIGTLIWTIFK